MNFGRRRRAPRGLRALGRRRPTWKTSSKPPCPRASGTTEATKPSSQAELSPVASSSPTSFSSAPPVWSELVNRDSVSSNSVKARRDLLHAMINAEGREPLGFEGFPAERGLYETLLRSTELHRQDASGTWRFMPPGDDSRSPFRDLWEATRDLFPTQRPSRRSEIYALWSAPPFGMKLGIQPVILTAFLLAHKANVAVYKDGMFVPRLTDFDIDECLQDPDRFSLRWVAIDEDKNRILEGISEAPGRDRRDAAEAADPLEAARGLVAMVFNLPEWARRTPRWAKAAKDMRDMLLKASDPHKVLFVDLASLLGASRRQMPM